MIPQTICFGTISMTAIKTVFTNNAEVVNPVKAEKLLNLETPKQTQATSLRVTISKQADHRLLQLQI